MTQPTEPTAPNGAIETPLPRIAIRFKNPDGWYTCTFGRFPDGRPSEIFLDGPCSFGLAARMATVALQHGVPLSALRGALISARGPMATAIDRIVAFVGAPSK